MVLYVLQIDLTALDSFIKGYNVFKYVAKIVGHYYNANYVKYPFHLTNKMMLFHAQTVMIRWVF